VFGIKRGKDKSALIAKKIKARERFLERRHIMEV